MYWVMFSERKNEQDAILSGVPALIEDLDLEFDQGIHITGSLPVIEYEVEEDDEFNNLTDSLVAPGFNGILANERVVKALRDLGANNIQEFPVLLKSINNDQNCSDYMLINVIGDADIIDYDKSDISLFESGNVRSIDSLSFIDTSNITLHYIFRLSSCLPIVIAHDKVKQAFEANNITGFTFYKPEEFSL
ncbi:DUF1629 domain-containing protein [uncultured Shewanella sp.]|uniref:imm11 family protein n=1 Tax=uncultured Shewanella sp. TaxID=173975 RepID=UPI00261FFAED|nr:DUF1629 domain-containing protein [uncultured Shewanella sp.]